MPGEHHVKFMLRIPHAMRERIASEAEVQWSLVERGDYSQAREVTGR